MRHRRSLESTLTVGFLATLIVGGCGSDNPNTPVALDRAPSLTSFVFDPIQPSVGVGDAVLIQVSAQDFQGNVVPNVTVEWSTSTPWIANVTPNGLVTGVSEGLSVINAVIRPPAGYGSNSTLQGSVGVAVSDSTPILPGDTLVALPRHYVDTSEPLTTRDVRVPRGASLQAAIDAAQRGDRLLLAPGAVYGSVRLPAKNGTGWVVIQTDVSLPAGRMTPAAASALNLAVLEGASANDPVVYAHGDVSYYRIQGVEIRMASSVRDQGDIVRVDTDRSVTSAVLQPSFIVFDRVYVHGNPPALQLKRCVALSGRQVAVTNSSLLGCSKLGQDSQAIWSADGLGPTAIINNHLQAGSEVVMFGGLDPHVAGVVPSDIEVRGNYFHRPETWKDGTIGDVKNLFEVKNAARLLLEGNVFEGNWSHAQSGYSILIKSTNQEGSCSWCTADDITIRWNLLDDIENGIQVVWGNSTGQAHGETERVLIENNVLARLGGNGNHPGEGVPMRVTQMPSNITIRNNTYDNSAGNLFLAYDGLGGAGAHTRITDNVGWWGLWGVWVGDGANLRSGALQANTIIGGQGDVCGGNQCVAVTSSQSVMLAGHQYVLPTVAGAGADLTALAAKLQGVR